MEEQEWDSDTTEDRDWEDQEEQQEDADNGHSSSDTDTVADSDSDSDSSDEDDSDSEDDDEIDEVDATTGVNSMVVYSRYQLLHTASYRERAYLKRRPGICAGLSLAWLQLIVRDDVSPRACWPEVSFARQLQEYIEKNSVRHQYFPEVAYMSDEGRRVFDDVDEGLRYVWHTSGSYILLIRPKYARIGHAVAYSDRYSYPRGFLMNPNKGAHCCYTFQGLADEFRSDRFISRSEHSTYGPEFIIIRIGKPNGTEAVAWHAGDQDSDQVQEYIQYGV